MTAAMPLVQEVPAEPAVRAEDLGKTYGAVTVLSDVTLDIPPAKPTPSSERTARASPP
jgi:hypothetical protein